MEIVVGGVFVVAAVAAVVWVRVFRGDEVFDGLTPGLVPVPGQPALRRRVRRGQQPPIAVRFTPPDGLNPGLVGVAIDGRVDPVELSATLIDLAGRGWFTMHPVLQPPATKPVDWELHQSPVSPSEELTSTERVLLDAVFASGPTSTLNQFRANRSALQHATQVLHGEAAARRWFLGVDSQAAIVRWIGVAGMVIGGVLFLYLFRNTATVGLAVAGLIAWAGSRIPAGTMSAEGAAARAQAESFKLYLATAEAEQLRFEVGIDVFSRYLPYAMVLGVVDHWRTVFADALNAGMLTDTASVSWLVLDDTLNTVLLLDLLSGSGGIFDGLVGDFGNLAELPGLDGIGEGLSDFGSDVFDGFGDFGGFGD